MNPAPSKYLTIQVIQFNELNKGKVPDERKNTRLSK